MVQNFSIKNIHQSQDLKKNLLECEYNGEIFHFYKGDFYMDGKRFLPITTNGETSLELFGNLIPSKYEEYLALDVTNLEKSSDKILEKCFIVGSNINKNYYHNLIDFYARLFLAKKFAEFKIILGHLNFDQIIQGIFNKLDIKNKSIYVDHSLKLYKNSIFLINKNLTRTLRLYRNTFFNKNLNVTKFTYVSRGDSQNRTILNEEEILVNLQNYNFQSYNLSQHSFDSQIKLFNESKIIVSMHGAGLSNLIFSPTGQIVIEIVPNISGSNLDFFTDKNNNQYDQFLRTYFKNISSINKLEHYFYFGSPSRQLSSIEDLTLTSINIDIHKFENFIKSIIIK